MKVAQERIVDVVLGMPGRRRGAPLFQRLVIPLLVALLAHIALLVLGQRRGPSLEPWSAELALQVHRELSRLHVTEVVPLPEPEAATPAEPAPEANAEPAPPPTRAPAKRVVRAKASETPTAHKQPAQAAQVLTTAEDAEGPVDLSDSAFVSGNAAAFVGGASAKGGDPNAKAPINAVAKAEPTAPKAPLAPKVAVPVALGPEGFDCPWPQDAMAHDIYQAVVTLRVLVTEDGSVQQVRIDEDPGYSLGRAAQACAKQTRFSPARSDRGDAVRAWSPPIRVRFLR